MFSDCQYQENKPYIIQVGNEIKSPHLCTWKDGSLESAKERRKAERPRGDCCLYAVDLVYGLKWF